MTNSTHQNELAKRRFYVHLKGGEGFAKDSVTKFAEAIAQWQKFSEDDDFSNFTKEKAMAFTDWLKARDAKTDAGHLSMATQYNYLRRVKRFFKWLSEQSDYKQKVRKTDVDFLRLSKKDARIATSGTTKRIPTFDEVKQIIESITVSNEIDMRDRAIISFALITGMRISAITTIKMKNFDKETKIIDQNPGDGVLTKNSKKILTTFFPIGWSEPERCFMEWYDHLLEKGAQPDDPIFPSTLKGFSNKSDYSKTLVSSDLWSSSGGARKVFEKRCINAGLHYFHPHSFRHLIVSIMSETRLTEKEKRAISMNLGHDNVGTTFGSYGYGGMSGEDAVKIVRKITSGQGSEGGVGLSDQERAILEKLLGR
ncbi:MAG: site-specific integrase [Patescibacteria group bacterium]